MKKTGILLINLGTPCSPTPKAIRAFLSKFLHDKRVIEIPRALWCPLLHGLILPLRPRKLVEKYKSIQLPEGAPLKVITARQRDLLCEYLKGSSIEFAMSYGEPSIKSILTQFQHQGIEHLIVLPLYPQNSATTVGPAFDQVTHFFEKKRAIPSLHFISGYADFPPYITALKQSVLDYWEQHGRGTKLIFSFHGLPERNIQQGDPYLTQCQTTAHLLAESLKLKKEAWEVAFQSRFGKAQWIKPYLEPRLIALAQAGVTEVDVLCPGFAADCLETLEEVALTYQKIFQQAGGKKLRYIPALNDSSLHIQMMAQLIEPMLEL